MRRRRARSLLLFGSLAAAWGCGRRGPDAAPEPRPSPSHAARPSASLSPASARAALPAPPAPLAGGEDRPGSPRWVSGSWAPIFAQPSKSSAVIGKVAPGGFLVATPEASPAKGPGCEGPFTRVSPAGWVCGDDVGRPLAGLEAMALHPGSSLPAAYGESLGSPVYARVPTEAEQQRAEPGLDVHRAQVASARKAQLVGRDDEMPPSLRGVDLVSMVDACPASLMEAPAASQADAGSLGTPLPAGAQGAEPVRASLPRGAGVAWVGECEAEGRAWLVTPERFVVPRDKVARAASPAHRGREVPSAPRSLAFVTGKARPTYRMVRYGFFQAAEATLPIWSAVVLTGAERAQAPYTYLEIEGGEGSYVLADHVARVEPSPRPEGVGEKERWVDVQASKGLLVAYEGGRPVWATLCAAPLSPRGLFVVTGKHLTRSTGEGTRARAHLPHVQDLSGGLALAGDPYQPPLGQASPGDLVRLSPPDADWLFAFTEPPLPEGWWSLSQAEHGTRVRVRE